MPNSIIFSASNIQNIQAGDLRAKYNAANDRILRYYIDVQHLELNLHKELSATEISILQNKADNLMGQWEKKYDAHIKKQNVEEGKELAEDITAEAELRRQRLGNTLHHTLSIDDTVDWRVLKDNSKFQSKKIKQKTPEKLASLEEPAPLKVSFLQTIFGQRKKLQHIHAQVSAKYEEEISKIKSQLKNEKSTWDLKQKEKRSHFEKMQITENGKVDILKAAWQAGQVEAVEEHASIVLENSDHDDIVPMQWELEYDPGSKTLLVEYSLPIPDDLPLVKLMRFVAATGELKETKISESEKKKLFDDLCYQICLRTIHELFEADTPNNIDTVAFNGLTDAINRATGQQVNASIISIVVKKSEFEAINLKHVDPRACFKSLKGVSVGPLLGMTPIAPIIKFEKTDKRFVDAKTIRTADDGTTNLAAMDWEDFEHLVRELFDKEFISRGGEVRVTQSSHDGGVDAIAFDPDPISGGKIVIQAKRYTRTVGVSAVRDLYGTTMNEGAIKGILVTTADYGPDAHKFAADKPLTLLTGSHLLHLLDKHGVKAKIDIAEARSELGLSV